MEGGISEEPLVVPSRFRTEDSLEGVLNHSALGPSPRESTWQSSGHLFADPAHLQVLLGRLGWGVGAWAGARACGERAVFYCAPCGK